MGGGYPSYFFVIGGECMYDPNQWEAEGNCKWCRRSKYCGSQCAANKRHAEAIVSSMVNEAMRAAMPAAVDIMERNKQ